MVYESVVEETIIALLQNKGYEFIEENDECIANRKLDDFVNRELLECNSFKKTLTIFVRKGKIMIESDKIIKPIQEGN